MGNSGQSHFDEDLSRLNLIGQSAAWRDAVKLVRRIAASGANTLIEGETGTGKELVARAIHYLGPRRDFPFIPLNCGALAEGLLEAELFGYERGAFTDARDRRSGLVDEARGGTLFLDEVEAMSPRAQVVLLRFLQDQTYIPVGGRVLATADVRIIAASNANLDVLVERLQFRSDLLFRLRVLYVRLPPLRERIGDVGLLGQSFLERWARVHSRPQKRLSLHLLAQLEAHHWPGNVRELESVILRALLMQDDEDEELTVPLAPGAASGGRLPTEFRSAKAHAIAEFERSYLENLLRGSRGNLSLAARLAGKDRGALKRLLKKHGIKADDFRTDAARFRLA